MNLVIFDLETTGLSVLHDEIIEFGAVRIEEGQVTASFQQLVKPKQPIGDDIFSLTNMNPQMFDDAKPLESVLPQFLKFISGYSLAGYNVAFDLGFLRAACDLCGYDMPFNQDALDVLLLARTFLPTAHSFRLSDIARHYQVDVQDVHRALADAQTTAFVLRHLKEAALQLPYLTLQQLGQLAGFFSPITASAIQELADLRFREAGATLPPDTECVSGLAFSTRLDNGLTDTEDDSNSTSEALDDARADKAHKSAHNDKQDASSLAECSTKLLQSDGPLARLMPGFEARQGQQEMVAAVAGCLEDDQHLIVEAGTGTGKSLAYLIPAALYAKRHHSHVVVATHTIALQEQIYNRDFPTLRKVIGEPVTLSVFKGRTHYLCLRRLWQEIRALGVDSSREDIEAYMTILSWLVRTREGCREELPMQGRLNEIWMRVQSEAESCPNKHCPFFKHCFYLRARNRAHQADIVVTNHSLIFSDLKADHRVLPKYDKLILDEAHHVEDEATKHLGEEAHLVHVLSVASRLVRDNAKHGLLPELTQRLSGSDLKSASILPDLDKLIDQVKLVRNLMEDGFLTLSKLISPGQSELRLTPELEATAPWKQYLSLVDELTSVYGTLQNLKTSVEEMAERETDADIAGRMSDAMSYVTELCSDVGVMNNAGDLSTSWVVWIERGFSSPKQISLHRAPIDVAAILSKTLFENKTVILTSATLSIGGKFDYTKRRLGLVGADEDGRLAALCVSSPFEFSRQAILCVPNDVPELARMTPDEAATWLSDSLFHLAKVSHGKLLALFTSHAMLRCTAAAIRKPLADIGLKLLAQGIDGSRTRILEAFRQDPNSVLFGAQSFWEGIDLPGDELVTLVIVRLPFAPPTHPVTQARYQLLEARGKSSFMEASLPEAIVRFRQGFGRLIRTVHDRGAVIVYDKRIVTQRYGARFIRSLPGIKPFVGKERDVIEHVEKFLQADTIR